MSRKDGISKPMVVSAISVDSRPSLKSSLLGKSYRSAIIDAYAKIPRVGEAPVSIDDAIIRQIAQKYIMPKRWGDPAHRYSEGDEIPKDDGGIGIPSESEVVKAYKFVGSQPIVKITPHTYRDITKIIRES